MKLTPIPQPSTGKAKARAFVDGPRFRGLQEIEYDTYEVTANAILLRELRRKAGLDFKDMRTRYNLGAVEVCGLEQGRFDLPPDQWAWLLAELIK